MSQSQPPRAGEHYDVLILGAGWGGLTAASLLAKAGRRVAVLEARDRAGGWDSRSPAKVSPSAPRCST